MSVGDVRHFHRVLEGDLDTVEPGWIEWARERVPSIPSEAIILLEREGELPLVEQPKAVTEEHVKPVENIRGIKNDSGKDRWSLLLVMLGQQVRDVLHGLMYGAKKYREDPADPNYRKVDDAARRFGEAAMRHLFDRMNGQIIDPESGQKNLALAIDNILFWMWHDDNPKQER